MPWRLIITRPAEKDLEGLRTSDAEAVVRALRNLVQDPSSADLK